MCTVILELLCATIVVCSWPISDTNGQLLHLAHRSSLMQTGHASLVDGIVLIETARLYVGVGQRGKLMLLKLVKCGLLY